MELYSRMLLRVEKLQRLTFNRMTLYISGQWSYINHSYHQIYYH